MSENHRKADGAEHKPMEAQVWLLFMYAKSNEQGRRQPSGAAKTLIAIAQKRPEVLNELAGQDSVV